MIFTHLFSLSRQQEILIRFYFHIGSGLIKGGIVKVAINHAVLKMYSLMFTEEIAAVNLCQVKWHVWLWYILTQCVPLKNNVCPLFGVRPSNVSTCDSEF